MFSIPMKKITQNILARKARTHNMPEDMREEALQEELEDNWNRVMGKAETYVQGSDILQGGYFSTLSMGNWHVVCEEAGIEITPGRVVAVINPVSFFDIAMNGVQERNLQDLVNLTNAIQNLDENEIIRFDACVSGALKQEMGAGRTHGGVPENKGWHTREDGVKFPELPDGRIVDQMMGDPQNSLPVWVRSWVEPVMMEGDADAGYAGARQNHEPVLAEGESLASGALFPCEWRVFVKNGEIEAIGNYYPQISRGETPEDFEVAMEMVKQAKTLTQTLLTFLKDHNAIPHHPQYEDRDGFNPDGVHFSLDFLEVENEDGTRRLVMIEGGPAHLRGPNWGAHPVSFGVAHAPCGIALSLHRHLDKSHLDAM